MTIPMFFDKLSSMLIHRSAWKGDSPNFACRILHRSPAQGREDGSEGRHAACEGLSLHVVVLDGYAGWYISSITLPNGPGGVRGLARRQKGPQ